MESIMTIDEAAKYLKVSKKKLAAMARQNTIPGKKVGGSWRFVKESIDEWLKSA